MEHFSDMQVILIVRKPLIPFLGRGFIHFNLIFHEKVCTFVGKHIPHTHKNPIFTVELGFSNP